MQAARGVRTSSTRRAPRTTSRVCGTSTAGSHVDVLRTAIVEVARRQGSLRTRFAVVDGEPRQRVDDEPSIALEFADLSGRDADLDAEVRARIERPFDLAAAAPVRFTLFRLGARRHALLRVWHHIVSDGLSTPLLQHDLTEAYAAARAGREPRWAPLAVDYADYSVLALGEGTRRAGRGRLARRLAAATADLPTLALPGRPGPSAVADVRRGHRVEVDAPGDRRRALRPRPRARCDAVRRVPRRFRRTDVEAVGDPDFAIGTPVSGRVVPELAPLVGFFANTLAIRVDLLRRPRLRRGAEPGARSREGSAGAPAGAIRAPRRRARRLATLRATRSSRWPSRCASTARTSSRSKARPSGATRRATATRSST